MIMNISHDDLVLEKMVLNTPGNACARTLMDSEYIPELPERTERECPFEIRSGMNRIFVTMRYNDFFKWKL